VFDRPDWRGLPPGGADTMLALPAIDAKLRRGEFYARLDLSGAQG
jgi:hypothetical protein